MPFAGLLVPLDKEAASAEFTNLVRQPITFHELLLYVFRIFLTDALLNISPMWAKASSHVRMFGAGNKLQPASLHAFQKGPRLQEIPAAPLPRAFSVARLRCGARVG